MTHSTVRNKLLMFGILMTALTLTACGRLFVAKPKQPTVVRGADGCEWVQPIYLSEKSISLLAAQRDDPEVKADIEKIGDHNALVERFCTPAH